MTDFRRLSDTVWASPQISLEELAQAKADGFTSVINNRPDGEEEGQPSSAEIGAAAKELGLGYRYIPVTGGGMTPDKVAETVAALEEAEGPTLAYCRSGTRSTFLWSLAEASRGADPQDLVTAAAAAGYDISPIAAVLQGLSSEARR